MQNEGREAKFVKVQDVIQFASPATVIILKGSIEDSKYHKLYDAIKFLFFNDMMMRALDDFVIYVTMSFTRLETFLSSRMWDT